jgi:hypothetical protein
MQRFWETVIEPIFELVRPDVIVEIGSDQGNNTENLVGFCRKTGATLHVIDPAPGYDVAEWRREHGEQFIFHDDLSLNTLPEIDGFDAVLIDGDHNWYTVFNELKLIERLCEQRSQDFPLVVLHDIGWPYGRRDLYYDPETIPEEYRKPHEKKGMLPGIRGLLEEGGMNRHLWNAVREAELQSGVLTAVEDFLGETRNQLEFLSLPGLHGLGMLIPLRLKEHNAELARFLEDLEFSPFVERYVGGIEQARLFLEVRRQGEVRELNEQLREARQRLVEERQNVREANENLRNLREKLRDLAKVRQDVVKLARWMGEMEDVVSALLNSRQWKAGRAVGELYRKASRKPEGPTAEEHLKEILGRFHAWREDRELSPDGAAKEEPQQPQDGETQGPGAANIGRIQKRETASDQHNIVLTGPGRSGTTLTCYLLNMLPDTIALSEPIAPGKYKKHLPDYEAVADGIEDFYREQRRTALERGVVVSKHVGGKVPANTKGMKDGVRQRIAEKGEIEVGKELSPRFYLAIKQPGLFTAILPTLAKRFPCYAIVRNPLAIVGSVTSVARRRERKNPPAIVRYDPEAARYLESAKDSVERVIRRLDYCFERYLEELPDGHVIRYEDIVESRGKALEVIVPAAKELDEPLENKNLNPLYDRAKVLEFGERLLASEGAYWRLYSKAEVEQIMEALA